MDYLWVDWCSWAWLQAVGLLSTCLIFLGPTDWLGSALLVEAEVHKTSQTMYMHLKPLPELHVLIFYWPKQVTQPNPKHRKIDFVPLWKETSKSCGKSCEYKATKAIYHKIQRIKQVNTDVWSKIQLCLISLYWNGTRKVNHACWASFWHYSSPLTHK